MAKNLVEKFSPYADEQFKQQSKRELLTNDDYDWNGAHTVKVYMVTTAPMQDYDRDGKSLGVVSGENGSSDVRWSRYGLVGGLDATTQDMTISRDRSFTFAVDKLDEEETMGVLDAARALARQNREVVIPEIDSYVYGVMCANAGTKPEPVTLTVDNLYPEILKASEALDNAEVPETGRVLVVTPAVYALMKQSPAVTMDNTEIGAEQRLLGVIGMLDGAKVVRVPAIRLPSDFGFMLAHPSATVAPVKLESFLVHHNPPGHSGNLVEGRVVYDAFVLDNKAKGIYYQAAEAATEA